MEEIPLYEEYRLIERAENEINGAWRGAHLLLFFLAFVFGSFCTFCFHMLMYLFEEKCVLFPKLLLPSEARHSNFMDYLPERDENGNNELPVDFVTTKWKDKSTCYLPTYVPLLSGVCGLVWTAMFLMCSSGNQTLTGLQRSWRILPPIFIFSLAMGSLCVYSSSVTQDGLIDLCAKLSEVTGGSATCSFHINVATLVFEKRIRGVYQAIRLTIVSAWLHTTCWLLAAALALLRVLLVVDFRLVRIKAELRGNLEKMMETHETQVRTVSPDLFEENEMNTSAQFKTKLYQLNPSVDHALSGDDFYYVSHRTQAESTLTLQDAPLRASSDTESPLSPSVGSPVMPKLSDITMDFESQDQIEVDAATRRILSLTTLNRERTKQVRLSDKYSPKPSTSKPSSEKLRFKRKKSNLKSRGIQTDPDRSLDVKPKVQIADSPVEMHSKKGSIDTLVPANDAKLTAESAPLIPLKLESSSSTISSSDSKADYKIDETYKEQDVQEDEQLNQSEIIEQMERQKEKPDLLERKEQDIEDEKEIIRSEKAAILVEDKITPALTETSEQPDDKVKVTKQPETTTQQLELKSKPQDIEDEKEIKESEETAKYLEDQITPDHTETLEQPDEKVTKQAETTAQQLELKSKPDEHEKVQLFSEKKKEVENPIITPEQRNIDEKVRSYAEISKQFSIEDKEIEIENLLDRKKQDIEDEREIKESETTARLAEDKITSDHTETLEQPDDKEKVTKQPEITTQQLELELKPDAPDKVQVFSDQEKEVESPIITPEQRNINEKIRSYAEISKQFSIEDKEIEKLLDWKSQTEQTKKEEEKSIETDEETPGPSKPEEKSHKPKPRGKKEKED